MPEDHVYRLFMEFLPIWKYFQKVSLMCAFCLFRVMHLVWNDVRLAEIPRWSTENTFCVLVKCKVNAWYRCLRWRTYWLCVRGWSKRTWLYVFLKHFQMNVLPSGSQGSQEVRKTDIGVHGTLSLVHWAPLQSLGKRASFVCSFCCVVSVIWAFSTRSAILGNIYELSPQHNSEPE